MVETAERKDIVPPDVALGIGALAHDLRSPLQAIIGAASVALSDSTRLPSQADRGRALEMILRNANRMTGMVTDWLDFSTLNAGGHVHVMLCDVDLACLCKDIVADTVIAHPHWSISLDIAGDSKGSWDPSRLSRILANLVTNAGQHGRGPDIRILVDGRSDETVHIAVSNRGTFPRSLPASAFEPLLSGDLEGRDRGTGLGLFIVSEFVKAHGGTLQVTSLSDSDTTTVSVHLPRRGKVSRLPGG